MDEQKNTKEVADKVPVTDGNKVEMIKTSRMIEVEEDKYKRLVAFVDDRLFKKKLLVASRVICVLLILAIVYFGYVNMQYGRFTQDKSSCYLCGYETMKSCDCVYLSEIEVITALNAGTYESFIKNYALNLATHNDKACEVKVKEMNYSSFTGKINFTFVNSS